MNDLLQIFLSKYQIPVYKGCHHGCAEEHPAIGYQITNLPDEEDMVGSSWGTVFYDCPQAVKGPGKRCEVKFPLDVKERDSMRDLHYELVGEPDRT